MHEALEHRALFQLKPQLTRDAERRLVVVYPALLSPRTLEESDVLDGGDVLPGFRIRVGRLFDDPD